MKDTDLLDIGTIDSDQAWIDGSSSRRNALLPPSLSPPQKKRKKEKYVCSFTQRNITHSLAYDNLLDSTFTVGHDSSAWSSSVESTYVFITNMNNVSLCSPFPFGHKKNSNYCEWWMFFIPCSLLLQSNEFTYYFVLYICKKTNRA